MKKLLIWASGFLSDNNQPSSKRLVGIVCAGFLCWTMYHNSFGVNKTAPAESLVYAVSALAFGCLGLTSAEKIFQKKDDKND
jgi:hypothetical protein